jgi:hypothetical protein
MKYLVDLIDISDMGVVNGGNRGPVEEFVKLANGDEFELGLEVDGGYEVVDEVGDVTGYIFLVPVDGES